MKKFAKIAAIVIGVIVLILIIVPFFINADSFRPTIQAKAQEALGRNVQIGKLSLSLFSGAVAADGISIADDPQFSKAPFVTAKSLKVRVDMMPLIFSRELHVNSIELVQPQVALISNAEGKWNYSSLGGSKPAGGTAPTQPAPSAHPPEKEASASNFSIDALEVTDGRVSIGQIPGKQPPIVYSDVQLNAKNVSATSKIPFTLSLKAPKGGSISADGTAGPVNMSDTSLTPLQLNLKNDAVELAGIAPTSGISGLLDMAAKFTSDGRQAHVEGNGQVKNFKATTTATPAKQTIATSYSTNYLYSNRQGTLAANVTSGKNTAKLTGNYTVAEATTLHLNLNAPNMSVDDLEALLPAFGVVLPSGAALRGGTLTANLSITGPADNLTIAGPVSLNNTRLAGFNLGSQLSSLGSIAGIKTGNDTTIQTFSSNINVTPAVTRADAINLVIPALGTMTGAGTVINQNLNFKMIAKVQTTGTGLLGAAGGGAGAKSIPIAITGTTSNPKFTPDVNNLVQNAVSDQINKQLGKNGGQVPSNVTNALGGLLGGKKKK